MNEIAEEFKKLKSGLSDNTCEECKQREVRGMEQKHKCELCGQMFYDEEMDTYLDKLKACHSCLEVEDCGNPEEEYDPLEDKEKRK